MIAQDAATTWKATLGQLELAVTRANFDTWLRDTVGLRHEPDRFVVGAQNEFSTEWLSTKLRPLIDRAIARVLGHAIDVAFEVNRPDEPDVPVLLVADDSADAPPVARRRPPPALNPALTFDAFVVGEENEFAYQAARKAANAAGGLNPLVIFGAAGLGKTHLLSAIGHEAYGAGRDVIFVTAEQFGNAYVRALGGGIEAFRSRFRGCDVLLLDDIQFLEGKEKFAEEFFHTFNELHAAGKQVVVACDRAPAQLSISDALRSRLQWGLMADLQKPSYATRLAILRAKAEHQAVRLSEEALAEIAQRCCPSVRELEGYLNRVIAYVPLVGGQATPEIIERALSPLVPIAPPLAEDEPPCADDVIAAVARRTGTTPADLRGRSRARDVAYARHLAMHLLRIDAKRTVAEIGRILGHRDHSTVIAGIERITLEQSWRRETCDDLSAVRAALAAGGEANTGS